MHSYVSLSCSVDVGVVLSCYGTYRFVGPGCDVYPVSILPCWKHLARSLVKWTFSSPTGWGPGRTRIQTPLTLLDTHRARPVIQLFPLTVLIQTKPNVNVSVIQTKATDNRFENTVNHRVNLHLSAFITSTDFCCWFVEGLHSLTQHTHSAEKLISMRYNTVGGVIMRW